MAAAAPPSPFTSPAPSPSTSASASDVLPELPLFVAKEAYVYQVPPATTAGHRAETWNVNNWLATVSLKVLQADDECLIRLVEEKTGELFAECPIPTDHRPLTTAVEPVIDSSRYFVLRIVDRDSQRHAFIGIGFRERNEASDFNAALHEYLQYIKRKRIAEAMRHAHEERAQAGEAGPDAEASPAAAPQADYSIKDGETLHLKISAPKPAGAGGFVSRAAARGHMGKSFSLLLDGHGGSVAALSPPPRRGSDSGLDMCVSPCLEASSPAGSPMHADGGAVGASPLGPTGRLSGTGDAELQQRLQGLHLQSQAGSESSRAASCSGSVASTSTAAAAAADEEVDEFGDFEAAADLTAGEEEVLQAPSEAGQAPS